MTRVSDRFLTSIQNMHMYEMFSFVDILKYTADKLEQKDDAILLEIQANIFFILSLLCENDVHRKVCILLPHHEQKIFCLFVS